VDHNYVKVIYRTLSDYGHFHSLYIANSLKQNCSNTRLKPPCVYETTYTAGQVLKIQGRVHRNGGLFLGENLQIFFTNTVGRLDEPQAAARLRYEEEARQMYVRHECNASRDVICQDCEKCVSCPPFVSFLNT